MALSSSRRTTSATLQCVFRPTNPKTTWTPDFSSSFAQMMFRSSSIRAFSSMTAVTCLPRSAARCKHGRSASRSTCGRASA